ncbi:hypothetical protein [Tardiphaga sp. 813_E8_N1_3]|uniref:hypothetical protein n=1 Tax=Tardiphaga sp. 813_E8_N1_3 TaxID=3240760 RepID=UPI003F1F8630
MTAWLKHQQRRFMRPDAGRYLRSDVGRYLAPERKWEGQPRIEAGEDGGGQFTYGLQYGGTSYDGDRPRVTLISKPDGERSEQDYRFDGGWLGSLVPPGIGHNSEGELEGAPEIPQSMPETREERMSFVRSAASWLFGRSAIAIGAFFGLLDQVEEIGRLSHMIRTANDPPSSLDDLQRRAQGPSEPGYENHHIVNQHSGNRAKFGDSRIEAPENVVRIPQLKHIELSRWYATKNSRFGGRSPQEVLREMSWEEQTRIGLEQLRHFKVLE